MNCSGKFFVPIVISGPAGFAGWPPPEPAPSPPQPASASATRTRAAAAAVMSARRISGYGRLVVRGPLWRAFRGQREPERAALAGLALGPDAAAVLLDDPVADRQPDAGAGVLALAVQAVERL